MSDYIDRAAVLKAVEPEYRPSLGRQIMSIPVADVAPVRHLNADDVYEPFYQWLGEESVSRKWETLRELIDALVESCGAKMDGEEGKK